MCVRMNVCVWQREIRGGGGVLGGCGQRENQMGFDGTKKISAKLPRPK